MFLLDVYDVFLSKLFSVREKDRDDLRVLIPQLSKDVLVRKFKEGLVVTVLLPVTSLQPGVEPLAAVAPPALPA